MKLDRLLDDVTSRIDRFLEGVDESFAEAFDKADLSVSSTTRNCRVLKEDGRTTITVDVPGRTHKDVSVSLAEAHLTVKVAITPACATAAGSYLDQRWRFRVRPELKAENIKARVENGLLKIVLEKGDTVEPAAQAIPVTGP